MLETLHIRNLALVTDLEVTFGPGLNTVTGETGAGKSLILGAVQLLLGGRVAASAIRRGESCCEVAASFRLERADPTVRSGVREALEAAGVDPGEDGTLLVRRVVTPTGSRAYVNGSTVPVGLLRDLGAVLVDVHGPHEHQSLLRPRCQLELLDAFAGLDGRRRAGAEAHARCRALAARLDELSQESLSGRDVELLAYQAAEIEAAVLEAGEEERLTAEYRIAANAQRLQQTAAECRRALSEDDGSLIDQAARVMRRLQELADLDPERGGAIAEQLAQVINLLQDLANDLDSYQDRFEFDEESLRRIEARLDAIQRLKRKYGPTVPDVLATLTEMRTRLAQFEDRNQRLESCRQELDAGKAVHGELCRDLTTERSAAAGRLAAAIAATLHRLGFPRADFAIRIEPGEPGPAGADRAEFCFAPNPGEDMLPLRQIASSGEVSRLMLAVKTVLTEADPVPVLIFDEVDANIGGRVAVAVAEELSTIGRRHQVLSITHLPQIAAAGLDHFQVTKRTDGERTITAMTPLRGSEREQEILRMLGAPEHSAAAAGHAREMLAAAAARRRQEGGEPCLQ